MNDGDIGSAANALVGTKRKFEKSWRIGRHIVGHSAALRTLPRAACGAVLNLLVDQILAGGFLSSRVVIWSGFAPLWPGIILFCQQL